MIKSLVRVRKGRVGSGEDKMRNRVMVMKLGFWYKGFFYIPVSFK